MFEPNPKLKTTNPEIGDSFRRAPRGVGCTPSTGRRRAWERSGVVVCASLLHHAGADVRRLACRHAVAHTGNVNRPPETPGLISSGQLCSGELNGSIRDQGKSGLGKSTRRQQVTPGECWIIPARNRWTANHGRLTRRRRASESAALARSRTSQFAGPRRRRACAPMTSPPLSSTCRGQLTERE
jgi:hypothetical protein